MASSAICSRFHSPSTLPTSRRAAPTDVAAAGKSAVTISPCNALSPGLEAVTRIGDIVTDCTERPKQALTPLTRGPCVWRKPMPRTASRLRSASNVEPDTSPRYSDADLAPLLDALAALRDGDFGTAVTAAASEGGDGAL